MSMNELERGHNALPKRWTEEPERYISLKKARELILKQILRFSGIQGDLGGAFLGALTILEEMIPADDVKPVVRGRWLTKEYMYGDSDVGTEDMWVDRLAEPIDYYAYCSICGKNAGYDGGEELVLSNFCPGCGADMRQAAGEQCSPLQDGRGDPAATGGQVARATGGRIATPVRGLVRNDGTEEEQR